MIRLRHILLIFCLIGAPARAEGIGGWTGGPASRPANHGPDTVVLKELMATYDSVPFDHKSHAQMAEMWDGCVTCHHRTPQVNKSEPTTRPHNQDETARMPACKSCHAIAAKDQGENMRMPNLKGAYHRQCLNCHKEWMHENACLICHRERDPKHRKAQPPTKDDIVGRMHPPIPPPDRITYTARFQPAVGNKVLFRHKEHTDTFGLKCVNCHHRDSCSDCHNGAKTISQRPVHTGRTWRDSHAPCATCHKDDRCGHCHYADDRAPPPAFDHFSTGQTLDKDHVRLACRQCHAEPKSKQSMTCGGAACHAKDPTIAYPAHRPGPFATTRLATTHPATKPSQPVVALSPSPGTPREGWGEGLYPPRASTLARPTKSIAPTHCVTADCHPNIKSFPVVHGPVNTDACDACHELIDITTHTFAAARTNADLCTYCHEFNIAGLPTVHKPVATGECLGCHDPHGGNSRSIVREDSIAELCARCHESMTLGLSHIHTPVARGQCDTCHSPHASRFPKLVDAVGADLCLACHKKLEQQVASSRYRHKAMERGCDKCHNVHASNYDKQLLQPVAALCTTTCHEHDKLRDQIASATHKHSVVTEGRACITCHAPHSSDIAKLMADVPLKICMSCHNQKIDGTNVAALTELLDPKMTRHSALKDGQCSGCHASHGNDRDAMLTKSISTQHYQKFSSQQYELCFSCHDLRLAIDENTVKQTNFRNGQRNLHWVHVVQQADRGEGCRVCHDVHASPGAKNVRDHFVFGKRDLPINFIKTDTGGTCLPGCHIAHAYDRDHAVPVTTQPATRPAPPIARSHKPSFVRFSASDIRGGELRIPDDKRTTILLFLPPDPAQAQAAVKLTQDSIDSKTVAPIAIFCGPGSTAFAQSFAKNISWPVIADETRTLGASIGLTGWPSIIIVAPDGQEIARIGGLPESLAMRLNSYLSYADGKIARPALEQTLTTQTSIPPSNDQRIARLLRVADALSKSGKAPDADKLLDRALKEFPNSIPLQIARSETLIQLDQADYALDLIVHLPAADLPPGKVDLLRGKALVCLHRWDQARTSLQSALKADPALTEAHYLLGQVLEAQKDFENAAREYRLSRP